MCFFDFNKRLEEHCSSSVAQRVGTEKFTKLKTKKNVGNEVHIFSNWRKELNRCLNLRYFSHRLKNTGALEVGTGCNFKLASCLFQAFFWFLTDLLA